MLSQARVCAPRIRATLVRRERLDAALLQAVRSRKLVLLCAPAGYGKTVALVQLLPQLPPGQPVAWVNVSEDDDVERLLTGLLAALDPYDLPWRVSPQVLPAMATHERDLGAVGDAVLAALEGADARCGLIVLDDMHRLGDPRVFRLFDHLLQRLPPGWTLAMTSREVPPLALPRLRVEQALAEFGPAELGFRVEEAHALAQAVQGSTDPQQVDQWFTRTQGWVAGLVVGLKSLGAPSARARLQAHRRMFEFLAEEVLGRLPAPMQTFLMRCSVLRELTVQRCEQVSGDPQSARWLEELERRDLFVTALDTEALTLRLHDLFREFLEDRLRSELPQEVAPVLRRAAEGEMTTARTCPLPAPTPPCSRHCWRCGMATLRRPGPWSRKAKPMAAGWAMHRSS